MKKVVYSCLFSNSDRVRDDPCTDNNVKLNGFDYIMFTNIPEHVTNSIWTPIYKDLIDDHPIYTAKHYKWLAHKYLLDYDIAIYVDAYLSPKIIDWNEYIDKLTIDGAENGVRLMRHFHRNCIYDECSAIARCRRDTSENMNKVIEFLKENNMPTKFGLSQGGLVVRHLKNKDFNNLCNELYELLLKFTYRDQAMLSYVFWKNNVKLNLQLPTNLYSVSGKMGDHVYIT